MLDLNLLREDKGGNPELLRQSQNKRFKSTEIVDKSVELINKWKVLRGNADTARMNLNATEKEIKEKKKASKGKDPCTELIAKKDELIKEVEVREKEANEMYAELKKVYSKVGNILHESVPISKDEKDNKIVKTWGEVDRTQKIDDTPGHAHHHKILHWLGGFDQERGTKIAGHRGYYLTGPGVLLNQALIQYGMKFLMQKGYTPVQPPYFMKREIMAETAELDDFDEMLYKITGEKEGEDDFYLIATAEQPISTMYRGEWLEKKQLPIKYAGISPCFRKEAGAHGKDTWGIFRIHQFEKVEQFIICSPEDSWQIHEEMIKASEEFYQSLKLPYRVVAIVSGALNNAASKKYDLEAWFPGYGDFRELVSCSNCTDYQSRAAEIRLRTPKNDKNDAKVYVHLLNGTLCACERTLCCILENYQTETGVKVPEVLQPYVGTDFLPFVETLLPGYKAPKENKPKKEGKKKEDKKEEKKEENIKP